MQQHSMDVDCQASKYGTTNVYKKTLSITTQQKCADGNLKFFREL